MLQRPDRHLLHSGFYKRHSVPDNMMQPLLLGSTRDIDNRDWQRRLLSRGLHPWDNVLSPWWPWRLSAVTMIFDWISVILENYNKDIFNNAPMSEFSYILCLNLWFGCFSMIEYCQQKYSKIKNVVSALHWKSEIPVLITFFSEVLSLWNFEC